MKTNIFNFIRKINSIEDELAQTKDQLAKIKKLNAVSNSLKGVEVVKEQNKARKTIINEFFPPELWKKEIKYTINKEIVTDWLEVLNGQFDSDNVVEVRNDSRGKEQNDVIFRHLELSHIIKVHIL